MVGIVNSVQAANYKSFVNRMFSIFVDMCKDGRIIEHSFPFGVSKDMNFSKQV